MTVSTMIDIGGELVDLTKPCDMVLALKKQRLLVSLGKSVLIIRLGSEEVTYNRANLAKLDALIAEYQTGCDRASGNIKRGRARSIRWV
ncbi:hypothetical protein [Roseibium alexandrii]|uniref:GpW protein n=1 Tax=Roseibium alexandrii (strain DSM 17067 / NCIMB 14079 / DFL-11) TaxID=244592 RepID=A0A5E8GU11_ROSAD|nr:hypothetical protein [Roseibium alexandrii]EEE42981.2 hypothetical protein SADFL11_267 [Roseibium alexandrii DFL-11]